MTINRRLIFGLLLLATVPSAAPADDPFLAKPYLQLGDAPRASSGDLALLWHADDVDADWTVESRSGTDQPWRKADKPTSRRVAVSGVAPHRVYRAALTGLAAGSTFSYKVSKGGEVVFSADAKARKSAAQPYRFVAFGDCAQGTAEQKVVAFRAFQEKPDFVFITGDMVYARGRVSEYREKYWPVYNADEASPSNGAPLIRSTLTLAAPGNHDIASRDLEKYPDTLAYFYYWDQPLNGPEGEEGGPVVAKLTGPEANRSAFRDAAGPAFPRMANFSFDYGNAHWTVLDANPYVDWADPVLRAWVESDLSSAKGLTWRFVAFHQPGFNSAGKHFSEQQMRKVAGLFEAGGVDVVFSGHVHNYQRSYPMKFTADPSAPDQGPPPPPARSGAEAKPKTKGVEKAKAEAASLMFPGRYKLDKGFDGRTNTRPDGVIYLITGAGGAGLYNPEQQEDPASWQAFTHKFVSKVHSLTVADVDGPTLTIRQVSAEGQELDRFVVTK